MSGTASRFQGRPGYNPTMMVGGYPARAPSMLPAVSAPPQAPPAALPAAPSAPAPSAPPQTPVSAGSVPMGTQGGATGADQTYGQPGMGENPGVIGGPNGMGSGLSYGTIGGTLGTLAGLASGVPGLGLAGAAAGTYADVRGANGTLASFGVQDPLNYGPALMSNLTFGLAGKSVDQQMQDAVWGDATVTTPNGLEGMAIAGDPYTDESQVPNMEEFTYDGAVFAGVDDGGYGDDGADAGGVDGGYGGIGDAGYGGMDGGYGSNAADGWMSGGYTGAGHPAQPAGTVHKGEVVIPAAQVARYGLAPLLALAEGSVAPSRLARLARG